MAITKNKNEIRLRSGNNFKVKYNNSWITLGNILSGKLTRSEGAEEVVLADGDAFEKRTTRKAMLEIVLSQVSKEILDTLDGIFSSTLPIYYYNGLANSKQMEIYIPEAEGKANFDIVMDGKTHQTVNVVFNLMPQNANASVTPNTDLPSDKYATGSSPVSGTNTFYVILETSA